jgi:hypothetical protein
MTPPLVSLACPRCMMVQAVPAASPRRSALQLRCLACHAPLGSSDDSTRVTGPMQVPTAPIDSRWHVMVDGRALGPLERKELGRLHRMGVIDDDALVWHEGFTDWARLADTATFGSLVGGRRPAPRMRRSISGVLDLTEEVDGEAEAPRRRLPPPVPPRRAAHS